MTTILELLKHGDEAAPAIGAPDREPLSYGALRSQVKETLVELNKLGVGRNDAVAIVLPNGPEMAVAFIAIASAATTAPLNPGYTAQEFEFYLQDLDSKLLVVQDGMETPATGAAERLGIPVARLSFNPEQPAGTFTLRGAAGQAREPGPAQGSDVALVLHTSGTTARPKIVPLSHDNVCASAHNIASTLALQAQDHCLNVMPLFHIHGLIAAVLGSLDAGALVTCTPGFNALKFFGWLETANPSWYTAVPTMHQAILSRAGRNEAIIEQTKLRFIRSSSASLPPPVMEQLEATFKAPVIESYGMTEAAHQMASNPLPPGARKPGSVGLAAGPEIGIMDNEGRLLEAGEIGEIVVRGSNITPGYQSNPQANNKAFTNGWFRTGDQGVMDDEGYLRLTDRLKEIINRGGEKISPREVDEALMRHPAVDQAVTFAVPHSKLGEDIAAAVVLKEGASADAQEIRAFVSERLANMKVPRKILLLDEIPKGATGKLQRIGLAKKLGLANTA
jgi:acyl-CoA synthetase (AMP-forming)/AMP-acid ligase II